MDEHKDDNLEKNDKKDATSDTSQKQESKSKISQKGEKISKFSLIKAEFKKIIWPSKKNLIADTITVIIVCTIFGLLIFGMDIVYEQAFKTLIGILK